MPIHQDWQELYRSFVEQYGEEKGEEAFYAYCKKHGIDYTKARPKRESFSWVGDLKPEGTRLIRGKALHPIKTIHPEADFDASLQESTIFSSLTCSPSDMPYVLVWKCTSLSQVSNMFMNAASVKASSNLSIRHRLIMFNKEVIFLLSPSRKFLSIWIRRKHFPPFSLHHEPRSIFSDKNGDSVWFKDIKAIPIKVTRGIWNKIAGTHFPFTWLNTCFYSYLRKFVSNLFKPILFSGSYTVTNSMFWSGLTGYRAICRKKPRKPNDRLSKFLFLSHLTRLQPKLKSLSDSLLERPVHSKFFNSFSLEGFPKLIWYINSFSNQTLTPMRSMTSHIFKIFLGG